MKSLIKKLKFIKLKIIILLLFINITYKKLKICICTLGKNENKYIIEFIEHYKRYGIDKIFLYDNNNINGERFDLILSDYIKNKFVEIINYRGKIKKQYEMMNDCYKKNNNKYDWLIFFDIDEFINLKYYKNIKTFLNKKRFNKCKSIYLNCFRHTDNDLLYYDNRPLTVRFPYINWNSNLYTLKSIIRGNIKNINITSCHSLDKSIKGCNEFGKIINLTNQVKMEINFNSTNFNDNYIDHYCYKSTEEYINKINKGNAVYGYKKKIKYFKIKLYFMYNKITLEKIKYIAKKTHIKIKKLKLMNNQKNN